MNIFRKENEKAAYFLQDESPYII